MFGVSLDGGKSIATLRDKLVEYATALPFIPDAIPSSHVRLSHKIEKQSRIRPFLRFKAPCPFLTLPGLPCGSLGRALRVAWGFPSAQELSEMARECGISSEASLEIALEWLKEMGFLIYTGDHRKLFQMIHTTCPFSPSPSGTSVMTLNPSPSPSSFSSLLSSSSSVSSSSWVLPGHDKTSPNGSGTASPLSSGRCLIAEREEAHLVDDFIIISPRWVLEAIGAITAARHTCLTNHGEVSFRVLSDQIWRAASTFPAQAHFPLVRVLHDYGVLRLVNEPPLEGSLQGEEGDAPGIQRNLDTLMVSCWWLDESEQADQPGLFSQRAGGRRRGKALLIRRGWRVLS